MSVIDRYMFKQVAVAFVASLFSLTAIVWLTEALRQINVVTLEHQSLLIYLGLTALVIPPILTIIIPVALLIGVIYALNRLSGDSELIVLSAGGFSPWRILRPYLALGLVTALCTGILSLWLMPWSFRETRNILSAAQADFVTHVARPGAFNVVGGNFIFHYRAKGADNDLRGLFMQDRRDPSQINTYIAEEGATLTSGTHHFLLLRQGSVQRASVGDPDPAIVQFDQYAIDLSSFDASGLNGTPLRARETPSLMLLTDNIPKGVPPAQVASYFADLADRFLSPAFAVVFTLFAFAALGRAATVRRGRQSAIALAALAALLFRLVAFWTAALSQRHIWGIGLSVLWVAVCALALLWLIFKPQGGLFWRPVRPAP